LHAFRVSCVVLIKTRIERRPQLTHLWMFACSSRRSWKCGSDEWKMQ